MPEGKPKPPENPPDPAQLAKLLEIELMQKRAEWQRAAAGRKNLRIFSFVFLLLVIGAALIAFYLFFSGALNNPR